MSEHSEHQDIDFIFRQWPYQAGVISARLIRAHDGRELLQMRIEMGVLQMETTGRPDGERPHGKQTYLEWLQEQAAAAGPGAGALRRAALRDRPRVSPVLPAADLLPGVAGVSRAVADADHTLAMMDFVAAHCPESPWTISHERYRALVHFHRAQAAAMTALERSTPQAAVEEINAGLAKLREVLAGLEDTEQVEDDELITQLVELKESLRKEYQLGPTLAEQLSEAVAAEEYERAARLRDEIARQQRKPTV